MLWVALAGSVLVAHLLFVAFVVFGGLLALRWPRVAWLHVPAALWGCYVEFAGVVCPLTPLENRFLELAGRAGYAGGFIDRYLLRLVYPQGLGRDDQIVLGSMAVLMNVLIYAGVLLRRRRGGVA